MKLCQTCGQHLAEEIVLCPSCGTKVAEGRQWIDDYRILDVLHEGHASILCKAVRKGTEHPVMIRLFTRGSGVDTKVAARLTRELAELRTLPRENFIAHRNIHRSDDGFWYRVSEWVDALGWGDLVASGRLNDPRTALDLCKQMAETLEFLHQKGHFIPHLILNDIMVVEDPAGKLTVKIDYKLSRFIDRRLDRPGPMLKALLDCHPDIRQQRPLDLRTDIWSLGRVFAQVLTADFDTCRLKPAVDQLALPKAVKRLFRAMLADDPDLRPQSMAQVAAALDRVSDEDLRAALQEQPRAAKEIGKIHLRQRWMAAAIAVVLALGASSWLYFGVYRRDEQALLRQYANQYAGSVAFVAVEYWLRHGPAEIYRNQTEGTAFLVDRSGYLLTNRHVACPWLEDTTLLQVIARLKGRDPPLTLGHRMFLWFEGQKAFTRLPGMEDDVEAADVYALTHAYRSDAVPRVIIAGVARPPVKARQRLRAPLGDDFAVLKIDKVPPHLPPLPLDQRLEARKIPKLAPVITLGFPLGSRTQQLQVNVSVTYGHVRRSFEQLIQVDTSLYGGNSGGPIMDTRGRVIGIASAVAIERAPGMVPVFTPLSDIGMVLPITRAAHFLGELKAGRVKWNGSLDLALGEKIQQINALATQTRWREAKVKADGEIGDGTSPALVMTAGVLGLCTGEYADARGRFIQALALDDDNQLARFLLYMIDWMASDGSADDHGQRLLDLDWRSQAEFLGYLVRVLQAEIPAAVALEAWDTPEERAWLAFAVAQVQFKAGLYDRATTLFKAAALDSDPDDWIHFLARSRLTQISAAQKAQHPGQEQHAAFNAAQDLFDAALVQAAAAAEQRQQQVKPLRARLADKRADLTARRRAAAQIRALDADDRGLGATQAFLAAMAGEWAQALSFTRQFLADPGREDALRLKMGLLESQLLQLMGRPAEAQQRLERFLNRTRAPWYQILAAYLMDRRSETDLRRAAGESPEHLITAHTALGLQAEGRGQPQKAIGHYREALGSYMDDWLEYDLAFERLKHLRRLEKHRNVDG